MGKRDLPVLINALKAEVEKLRGGYLDPSLRETVRQAGEVFGKEIEVNYVIEQVLTCEMELMRFRRFKEPILLGSATARLYVLVEILMGLQDTDKVQEAIEVIAGELAKKIIARNLPETEFMVQRKTRF